MKGFVDENLFHDAIEAFGKEHQVKKCIEELEELSVELKILLKKGKADKGRICDEIADVWLTTMQMMYMFDKDKKITGDRFDFKVERLKKLIHEKMKENE